MKNLFLLLLVLQFSSFTAQTNFPLVKWVNNDAGLKQLSVNACVADDNGFVWIATEMGLYRYNWNKVMPIAHHKYKNLSKQRILDLYKDDETGIIYFHTDAEGKTYSIDNNYINQLSNDTGRFIKQYFFLKSSHPMYNAIVKYNVAKKDYYKKFYRHNEDAILTTSYYCIRNNNSVDLLTSNGKWSTIDLPEAGNALLMKFNASIFVLGKKTIQIIEDQKLISKKITCDVVLQDFLTSNTSYKMNKVLLIEGQYYLNFKNNIYKIQFDTFKQKLFTVFLFKSPVNYDVKVSYSKPDDAYLFASRDQGMAVIKPNAFHFISTFDNTYNYNDYAIVKQGNNWYNYNGWIYNENQNKVANRRIANCTGSMRFLLEYKDNFFYEANQQELISIIDLKTKTPFKIDEKLKYLVGFTYQDARLWVANEKNCAYLSNDKWVFDTFLHKAIKPKQMINAIQYSRGNLIFATTKGVFLHKPFSSTVSYIKGLETVNARYIKPIDESSYWIGCYGEGLFLIKNNIAYKVVDANIDIATTHAIEEDKFGNLWISTNNGLLTVKNQQTISNTLKGNSIDCYIYTVTDGLPSNEFNGGSTFPSLKTNDGIIGFPSMKGFVWFNPSNVNRQLFSGNIVLDEVLVDNQEILPIITGYYKIDKKAEIISLKMDYGYSGNTNNLSHFYKFADQKDWTAFKGKKILIPRYKKGIQKLQIKIKTHGFDAKYDVIRSFSLNFEPRFNETIWFWVLIFNGTIILISVAYLLGQRMSKKKEKDFQDKIDLKTRQLQEIILELSLTKETIKKSLDEKEILLREIHHRVKNNLQLIMSMLNIQARRGNYEDIFDFIKKGESRINAMALIHGRLYLSDQVFDKINIQNYFEDLIVSINEMHNNTDGTVQIKVNANNLNINLSTAISLGLIINELISNSLKHGFSYKKKGIITIQILYQEDNLYHLIYEDNGIGFDAERQRTRSFGLELISLLASQMKGHVQIDTTSTTQFVIYFREIAQM